MCGFVCVCVRLRVCACLFGLPDCMFRVFRCLVVPSCHKKRERKSGLVFILHVFTTVHTP